LNGVALPRRHPHRATGAGVLLGLVLAAGVAPLSLADFESGMAAYRSGDFESARREWRALADQGVVEAAYNLGLLHQQGKGVPADPTVAHGWYLRAAEGGYARAQYRVAEMYEAGEGIRADLIQAHLWFREAGRQKYLDAKKRRRKVADRMTPEQIAYAEMLARHRKRGRPGED